MNNSADNLQHNIRVYGWIKMLMKRSYFILIPVYLTEVGDVTIPQLGILAAIAGVTAILSNVPTGYMADRWSRRSAMIIGAASLTLGALCFALFPSFQGATVAMILEAIGYSTIHGASEALIHDTLLQQGRSHDYVRTLGRAQSFGLIGNVVLILLVPLTYSLDKRLPFLIGAVMASVLVGLMVTLVEPSIKAKGTIERMNIHRAMRLFVNRYTVVFFIALGLVSISYDAYAPFAPLILVNLGFQPQLQGIVYASASVFGAINGRIVHLFKRFSLLQYALFDLSVGAFSVLAIGLSRNLVVTMIAIVINMGFWRVRMIVYQDHLLGRFTDHKYKATLISVIGFFGQINAWMPVLFALIIDKTGYYTGFTIIGLSLIIVFAPLLYIGIRILDHQKIGLLPGKLPKLFTRPPK